MGIEGALAPVAVPGYGKAETAGLSTAADGSRRTVEFCNRHPGLDDTCIRRAGSLQSLPPPGTMPTGTSPPAPASLPPYSWRIYTDASISPTYIHDLDTANALILQYLTPQSPPPAVGFDLEWKPTYVKGQPENKVALVQLACSQFILVLQVSAMGSFPSALKALLADPRIVKAGVGIQGDVKKLQNDWRLESIRNCVDLAMLARSVDNDTWKGKYSSPIGLARLVEHYEKKHLQKGKITRSNWEREPLTAAQLEYASNDAHAGYLLYVCLMSKLSLFPRSVIIQKGSTQLTRIIPLPALRCFSFDCYRGRLVLVSDVGKDNPCTLHGIIGAYFDHDHLWSKGSSSSVACSCPSNWTPSSHELNFAILESWGPSNPHYDPGPPPPPRPESDKVNKKDCRSVTAKKQDDLPDASSSTSVPRSVGQHASSSAGGDPRRKDRWRYPEGQLRRPLNPNSAASGQSRSSINPPASSFPRSQGLPQKPTWKHGSNAFVTGTWRPRQASTEGKGTPQGSSRYTNV